MNHENEVKVMIPARQTCVYLTIMPYKKCSWPMGYSLKKIRHKHWAMNHENKVKVKIKLPIVKYFHTPNIVDLLLIVFNQKTKNIQKFNYSLNHKKMRSWLDDTCQLDMYNLQSFFVLNIERLLFIVSNIWT